MDIDGIFLLNSMLLGVGLSMDAFSVSIADGLHNPLMGAGKMSLIAGTFAAFQFLMPMIGWVSVRAAVQVFQSFEGCIPWIALALLSCIGINMIKGARYGEGMETRTEAAALGSSALLMQGAATSMDALSVGFTIAEYEALEAFLASLIIAFMTFILCVAALLCGRKCALALAGRAQILGGVILIAIGLEIFVAGIFF